MATAGTRSHDRRRTTAHLRVNVWQLKSGPADRLAMLVLPEADQVSGAMAQFGGDGSALRWTTPPRLQFHAEPRRKPLPRGDVSPFLPGALVLNAKARAAFGVFLEHFGQLLPLQVDGDAAYFFNATRVIGCIDRERSQMRPGGTIGREAFRVGAIPVEPRVFKAPETARSRIYANAAAKKVLEDAVTAHAITGLQLVQVGA